MGSRTLVPERVTDAVARGRAAFAARAWVEARRAAERLRPGGAARPVRPRAAGHGGPAHGQRRGEPRPLGPRASGLLASGDQERAARCAVQLAIRLLLDGEPARSGGWLARGTPAARRGPARLCGAGIPAAPPGNPGDRRGRDREASRAASRRPRRSASASATATSTTLARQGQGRALIRLGETAARRRRCWTRSWWR